MLPVAGILASIGCKFLGGLFKGTMTKGVQAVTKKIKEKTGIDVEEFGAREPTSNEIMKLRQFELDEKEMILNASLEVERLIVDDLKSQRQLEQAAYASDDRYVKRTRP